MYAQKVHLEHKQLTSNERASQTIVSQITENGQTYQEHGAPFLKSCTAESRKNMIVHVQLHKCVMVNKNRRKCARAHKEE